MLSAERVQTLKSSLRGELIEPDAAEYDPFLILKIYLPLFLRCRKIIDNNFHFL